MRAEGVDVFENRNMPTGTILWGNYVSNIILEQLNTSIYGLSLAELPCQKEILKFDLTMSERHSCFPSFISYD